MEALQRSSTTFRRSGSSGLVWEERFAPGAGPGGGAGGEMHGADKKNNKGEEEGVGHLKRSRSQGSGGGSTGGGYRAGQVPPTVDPPSPKVSVCSFCSFFKTPASSKHHNSRRRH
jgi:Domain of unknown function (DUF4666)